MLIILVKGDFTINKYLWMNYDFLHAEISIRCIITKPFL